jgi:HTH-type transcriptional regulator / antitoxin HipB
VTLEPVSFLRQYPTGGTGILCFRQTFARPTSDMPNSWESVPMGVAQTFSYSSARIRRIPVWLISRSYRQAHFAIEERPRQDPSAARAARNQGTGSPRPPELFAWGIRFVSKLTQSLCHRASIRVIGCNLGGKAPIPRESPNVETIARTPFQLGNSIRQRRRQLGLTQDKLAGKIGMRQRTVSDLESSAAARVDTVLGTLAALDLELVIRPRTKGSHRDIERLF